MFRFPHISCLLASIALALSLTACATSPGREPPPKINELRPANPLAPQTQPSDTKPIQAMVRRVDLPLSGDISKAWLLTTTAGLDEISVALWQANGFRVALLDMKRYPEFVAALPDKFAIEAQVVVSTGTPTPFSPGAPLKRPRRLKLTTVTNESVELLGRGTPQLIANFAWREDGVPALTLAPHHYFPQATIEIRSPLETQLDGRVFDELALHAPLPPDRILVVALDRPAPPATQPADSDEATDENPPVAETETATTQPAEPAKPRPPMLGDLILTSARMHRPLQRVIMIGVPK